MTPPILVVGEVLVDFAITPTGEEDKMRLGGIAHAARGLWSLGEKFSAAVYLPKYLEASTRAYFLSLGCTRFEILGYVMGSPNVAVIHDAKEIDDQGYDFLLRDEKQIERSSNQDTQLFSDIENAFIIPGAFDLLSVANLLTRSKLHVDVAYDVGSFADLQPISKQLETVFISTSSDLFSEAHSNFPGNEQQAFADLRPNVCVIKENRGGSRVVRCSTGDVIRAPAQLGKTVNSVGVGDVYDVAFLAFAGRGIEEAAYRASYVSSAYAQTTVPDILRQTVKRDLLVTWETIKSLGGVSLTWTERTIYEIYLAAPDFSYIQRGAIDRAISALGYHNFRVRRPVQENGELNPGSDMHALRATYRQDLALMHECRLVFAVPSERDPGTVFEIGYAVSQGIPVIVFDPERECDNTMLIASAFCYSSDLEECVSAVYTKISQMVGK